MCFALISLGIMIGSRNEKSIIMKVMRSIIQKISNLLPQQSKAVLTSVLEYLFYTRNPVMQIVYVLLMSIGYMSYMVTAYPYVNESLFGQLPFLLLGVNMFFFITCSCVDPGVVDKNNFVKHINRFPYDENMYHEKSYCETCDIEKPARSKHCSVCNQCVTRFDHHCTWVNNCIGEKNYKFFLLFLSTLVLITFLSSFLVLMVFINIVDTRKLYRSKFTDQTGNVFAADLSTIIAFLVGEYKLMSFLFMYLFLLFIVLGCFFCFHLFLLLTNKTTNEICKQKKTEETSSDTNYAKKMVKRNKTNLRNKICSKTENKVHVNYGRSMFKTYNRGVLLNILEVFSR